MSKQMTFFFDVGGVLLTNAWDTATRRRASEKFGLADSEFQTRHGMLKTAFETGQLSLDDYIRKTVFHNPRDFSEQDFRDFMFAQSQQFGDTLDWLRKVASQGEHRFFTLNNESQELHEHRVRQFGLDEIFEGFITSCYLGTAKPDERIYLSALGIAGVLPEDAVFFDDRDLNIEPAAALGMTAFRFQGLAHLQSTLARFGIDI
ncbi:MAG: HAD-IA family hydrolase [Planctomycetota bacterium]|nr:HAD-IA family hydrolase [Planctomycetota bacterium]